MNKQEKLKRLQERKKQLRQQRERKLKEDNKKSNSLKPLLEGQLEQAELILSAKDTVNKIQDMSEDLAKMQVEDLLPLVDDIKGEFGPELSEMFEKTVNDSLGQALDAMREARESTNNAVLRLEGKISDEDVESGPVTDMNKGEDDEEGGEELELDFDSENEEEPSPDDTDLGSEGDDESGEEELDFGDEEPLGREKKEESRKRSGKRLSETENLQKGEKVKITGGDHKGKTGKIKQADVRGENSLVTINGNDEYVPTKHIKKQTNESKKKK